MTKKLLNILTAFLICININQSVLAQSMDEKCSPDGLAMAVDGVIIRPITLAATVVGAAIFVVTLPFSAIAGNSAQVAQRLVVDPAAYTFTRCLGCTPVTEW